MPSNSLTRHIVLKKLRTKTLSTLRRFGIRYSKRFTFFNDDKLNTIKCEINNIGMSAYIVEKEIANYANFLEDEFGTVVNIDTSYDKFEIDNITVNIILKIGKKYPKNMLQPNYFGISGTEISYSSYSNIISNKIDSDNILSNNEKKYLKNLLVKKLGSTSEKFDDTFVKLVSTNFSEIVGPLLIIEEMLDEGLIENINAINIKFPSAQNSKHDYEIINKKEIGYNSWLVSVKGGRAAKTASLYRQVNVIKFNNIFDSLNKLNEKKYGKIQTIVAKNIMKYDRYEGPLRAVIEILNLRNDIKQVNEIISNLFVATKNKTLPKNDKDYIVKYIKEKINSFNRNQQIEDEIIVNFIKNVSQEYDGNYRELSFICERAIIYQSDPYEKNHSNYKKFVYDYLKENNIIIQQIAIQKANLKLRSETPLFKELKKWYALRTKNSPGHFKDKIGIDPIGR